MTAAAVTPASWHGAALPHSVASERSWTLPITAGVLGLCFFVAGHDMNVSLAEAYTQNAEQMELAAAGGNSLRRIAFLAIGGWGLLLCLFGKQPLRLQWPLAASIGGLFLLIGASFVWADDPGMCLRRMFTLFCALLAAVGIARTCSIRDLGWLAVWTLGAWAVVGILAELRLGTFRPWSGDYRFAGTVHPNTQGPALAALCLAAFGLARERGRGAIGLWIIFAIGFSLLVLTKSRTTTLAIIVSLAAVQWAAMQTSQITLGKKLLVAGVAAWLGSVSLWLIWICGFNPLTDFRDAALLGRAEESDTLSGRAFIWPEVLQYIAERPVLGYGYESFWTPARIDSISTNLGWGLREAHNAYLETCLSLGLVGLVVLLTVIGLGFFASLQNYQATRRAADSLPIGLTVFALINAGLESGIVVVTLVSLLLAGCYLRLALFGEASNQPLLGKATLEHP